MLKSKKLLQFALVTFIHMLSIMHIIKMFY